MRNEEIIEWLQERVRLREYRLTFHAELERDNDQLTLKELEEALLSDIELLEDYPNDPRGMSSLVLGFTNKGTPIHIVCGRADSLQLIVITVYIPDANIWLDNRIRKE
ncbi:MAG: DUF4258 domain-containing protein [Ignavibacteriae bacterium]|nr:DUF4258 domain-containing protein [Ignavibacteriota bacterium]